METPASLPVTEGFTTAEERFDVAAKLGWLEGELTRANWPHAQLMGDLTAILCRRIDDLEAQLNRELMPRET